MMSPHLGMKSSSSSSKVIKTSLIDDFVDDDEEEANQQQHKLYEEWFRRSLEKQQQQQQRAAAVAGCSACANMAGGALHHHLHHEHEHHDYDHHHHHHHHHGPLRPRYLSPYLIPGLVLLVGIMASGVILALGVVTALRERTAAFDEKSHLLHHQLKVALEEYVLVGQWIRQVAHSESQLPPANADALDNNNNNNSTAAAAVARRQKFRQAYEYVTEQVLQFGSIGVVQMVRTPPSRATTTSNIPRTTVDVPDIDPRLWLEDDTRTFLRDFINTTAADAYVGFHQGSFFEAADYRTINNNNENGTMMATTTIPEAEKEEYAVVHLVEPIVIDLPSTYDWLDLDLLSLSETAAAIATIRQTERPVLTKCIPCFGHDSVVLLHPGVRMSWESRRSSSTNGNDDDDDDDISRRRLLDTLSLVEIRLDFLLFRVFQRSGITKHVGTFLFDSTTSSTSTESGGDTVGSSESYLAGAYYEIVDHVTDDVGETNQVDVDASVQDVYNAIVTNLTGSSANMWTISSAIDRLKRAAVSAHTQPDGSILIDGSRFRPYQPPTTIESLRRRHDRSKVLTLEVGSRTWTVVVTGDNADYPLPTLGYVILSAVVLLAGCACLAWWIYTSERRSTYLAMVRRRADAEKTDIVVRSAKLAAQNERELNDFIAHEVRNPLSAALSAATFVAAAVDEAEPLQTPKARQDVQEDMRVIEASLQFINDLLRNMLDIHRASSQQLALNVKPMDVLHDALEPVASMLYSRTSLFNVEVVCPENLIIVADKIRIKQVILNLGRNAAKFVQRGFVRFRAAVVDGKVVLYVEDSGPGIPQEKREHLFKKFQQSLDTLQQGTGIGLAVCHSVMSLMGGSIELDANYDSQVEGSNCKGARFVVNLALEPISPGRLALLTNAMSSDSYNSLTRRSFSSFNNSGVATPLAVGQRRPSSLSELSANVLRNSAHSEQDLLPDKGQETAADPKPLPDKLNVLFVDDDMILRKLFVRSLMKALPKWHVEQCSNGETSIRLADMRYYDIIFMDQYMASTDKQLLGTETVRSLRSKGVKSVICGLSANDLEADFVAAGADYFMIKPFPGKPDELLQIMRKLLKDYDPPFQESIAV